MTCTRWIKVAEVSGGAGAIGCGCCYMDRYGNQYAFLVVWQGAHEPFAPVFFKHWESIEQAAATRLRMAGLEAVALAGDVFSYRGMMGNKGSWDMWAEVRRCARGTRLWRRRNGNAQASAREGELLKIDNCQLQIANRIQD